jgi:hypothetical protein
VGGLIGVLFTTHAAAFAWALWDGDWLRVRAIFWQAPPTALMLLLLPLVHASDLRPEPGGSLALYYAVLVLVMLAFSGIALRYQLIAKQPAHYEQ